MATSYIFVPGKLMWAKGLAEVDPKYSTYNATLNVSNDEKAKLETAGCQATFKPTEDGLFSFKIKKSSTRPTKNGTVETSPPDVFLTNPAGVDITLDPRTVGNGSDVTAKLELYDTSRGGKGTRLVKVRVENLIEYTPNENQEDLPF